MNPLKSYMGQQSNPINGIMQMMNSGKDPKAIVDQILSSNPQARQFFNQMQNQANGRSPKEMAIQYASQKGISQEQLMQLAGRMGIK